MKSKALGYTTAQGLVTIHVASCYGFSYYYRFSDIAINSVDASFI